MDDARDWKVAMIQWLAYPNSELPDSELDSRFSCQIRVQGLWIPVARLHDLDASDLEKPQLI